MRFYWLLLLPLFWACQSADSHEHHHDHSSPQVDSTEAEMIEANSIAIDQAPADTPADTSGFEVQFDEIMKQAEMQANISTWYRLSIALFGYEYQAAYTYYFDRQLKKTYGIIDWSAEAEEGYDRVIWEAGEIICIERMEWKAERESWWIYLPKRKDCGRHWSVDPASGKRGRLGLVNCETLPSLKTTLESEWADMHPHLVKALKYPPSEEGIYYLVDTLDNDPHIGPMLEEWTIEMDEELIPLFTQ
ncbi:MAG: hypothetical protein AAFV07_09065 [Bacteroidota bacterium]